MSSHPDNSSLDDAQQTEKANAGSEQLAHSILHSDANPDAFLSPPPGSISAALQPLVGWWALFIPLVLYFLFAGMTYSQNYFVWWGMRLVYLFLAIPFFITYDLDCYHPNRVAQILIVCFLACIPCSLSSGWLSDQTFTTIVNGEVYLLLLLICLVWLRSHQRLPLDQYYIPATLLFLTLPLFLYYLFLDIWHKNEPILLLFSPLGWLCEPATSYRYWAYPTLLYLAVYCWTLPNIQNKSAI